jgi:hypothetical protein
MEGTNRDVTTWRKSTYSADNGGNCVEVGTDGPAVMVRDTKDRAGAALTFGPDAWLRFACRVKDTDKS